MKLFKTMTLAVTLLGAVSCGKKSDDTTASESVESVAKLSITCNGKACVGTEGQ